MNRDASGNASSCVHGADRSGWVERIRPWLGTTVRIGVGGLRAEVAEALIERGFEAIAAAHRTLGYHDPASELSRFNRLPAGSSMQPHPWLRRVLEIAVALSAESDGEFDVTVAPSLIRAGRLPATDRVVQPSVDWRDLRLSPDGTIAWSREGLVDLGGIAKGFAVDLAAEAMTLPDSVSWRIEAGGDLRVGGAEAEQIVLSVPGHAPDSYPVIALSEGSLASSARDRHAPVHFRGRDRGTACACEFVAVVAPWCVIADALTKVVLASDDDETVSKLLVRHQATAYRYDARTGWRTLGVAALASREANGRI